MLDSKASGRGPCSSTKGAEHERAQNVRCTPRDELSSAAEDDKELLELSLKEETELEEQEREEGEASKGKWETLEAVGLKEDEEVVSLEMVMKSETGSVTSSALSTEFWMSSIE